MLATRSDSQLICSNLHRRRIRFSCCVKKMGVTAQQSVLATSPHRKSFSMYAAQFLFQRSQNSRVVCTDLHRDVYHRTLSARRREGAAAAAADACAFRMCAFSLLVLRLLAHVFVALALRRAVFADRRGRCDSGFRRPSACSVHRATVSQHLRDPSRAARNGRLHVVGAVHFEPHPAVAAVARGTRRLSYRAVGVRRAFSARFPCFAIVPCLPFFGRVFVVVSLSVVDACAARFAFVRDVAIASAFCAIRATVRNSEFFVAIV